MPVAIGVAAGPDRDVPAEPGPGVAVALEV